MEANAQESSSVCSELVTNVHARDLAEENKRLAESLNTLKNDFNLLRDRAETMSKEHSMESKQAVCLLMDLSLANLRMMCSCWRRKNGLRVTSVKFWHFMGKSC